MALPPEHRTPRMQMLEAIVAATPREKLMDFPVLEPQDHLLIGTFIQTFNYMDLNLRRAIETFAHAKLLPQEASKRYPRIHSSEVAAAVEGAVKAMDPAVEDIPDTLNLLHIIERRREVRNLFGHWAARRIPNENAFMLLSKDEKDAKRLSGDYLGIGTVKTAILDVADAQAVLDQVVQLELWLARKTGEWHKRYIGD
jgi:hypothetical protein